MLAHQTKETHFLLFQSLCKPVKPSTGQHKIKEN